MTHDKYETDKASWNEAIKAARRTAKAMAQDPTKHPGEWTRGWNDALACLEEGLKLFERPESGPLGERSENAVPCQGDTRGGTDENEARPV